jgi:hypothetical protein
MVGVGLLTMLGVAAAGAGPNMVQALEIVASKTKRVKRLIDIVPPVLFFLKFNHNRNPVSFPPACTF